MRTEELTMMENITIIEDTYNLLKKGVRIHKQFALTLPMSILDIEVWEERLEKLAIPYVLAQVDTNLTHPARYKRGYMLFVKNPGLLND